MGSERISDIKVMSSWMRKKALEMAYYAGDKGAHLGAGLSSIEILACLYGGATNLSAQYMKRENRDIFIPSKAHCVLSFYTALAYSGFFDIEDLNQFEHNGSELPGHPIMNSNRGIEFSGGSLGMGLSQGIGMALAYKKKKYSSKVYVLLGDGECDEGSIWEGAMSAAHFKLDNLIVIIDCNKLQYDGATEDIMKLNSIRRKFEAFGFEAIEVDGHNIEDLYNAFISFQSIYNGKPKVIIAHTVKGKGVSFMENRKEWHHAFLSEENYNLAMREVEENEQ
ncbi:MAG: transketolase [Cellulosilyticum sp.]|nr:transketolase [Cellulosilyticum sp.]